MPRQKRSTELDRMEEEIVRAGTIGALERLAGVEQTETARHVFWSAYKHLPGAASLDAGCAELKRRIRAAAGAVPASRRSRAASK